MIITIVMKIKHTVNFTIAINVNIVDTLDTFCDILTCIFLHLNVVKFPNGGNREKIHYLIGCTLKMALQLSQENYLNFSTW